MEYIKSLSNPNQKDNKTCFLCEAATATDAESRRKALVLWQTNHVVVLMNRYPYANGHLLVAPKAHKSDLEELTEAEQTEIGVQTAQAVKLLKTAVSAQGFNIGINIGRVAGAGLPGHLHQHIVPRWGGDINFMHVVGQISIVPEATLQLYDELLRIRSAK
jgi:ATP adenylyltransferase